MRNCLSPPPTIKSIQNYTRNSNCECNCHFTDDCEQNLLNLTSHENNLCCSPSPIRRPVKNGFQKQTKNNYYLCSCDEICNCPCHCVTCVCCPCVKERRDPDTSEYYRNLYQQLKSELELEKKRNERMKYNKKMHENNMENSQKEKEILLQEIDQLKKKLAETMNKLKDEAEKNMERDDELFTFKQEEIPKLKETYDKKNKR